MSERLQKIIARAGLASRREAEKMILAGRVSVNHQIVLQLGTRADMEKDQIRIDGALIYTESDKIYIMLNKPRGYVTTLHDPQKRPIVSDLLTNVSARVFPVGRLDYDSQGLLLMTNDGDFAHKLLHPRNQVAKFYHVKIKGRLLNGEIRTINRGVQLDDGSFQPESLKVTKVNEKSSWLSMRLREGKNRIIRRALSSIGHDVLELVRTRIGNIELGDLKIGQYRFLTKSEVKSILL
jgi:23S rRNA pseudouridine2605 synthase